MVLQAVRKSHTYDWSLWPATLSGHCRHVGFPDRGATRCCCRRDRQPVRKSRPLPGRHIHNNLLKIRIISRVAGFMRPMVKKSHTILMLQFRAVGNSHPMPGRIISVGKSHKFRRRRSATRPERSGNPTFPPPARQTRQHHESI